MIDMKIRTFILLCMMLIARSSLYAFSNQDQATQNTQKMTVGVRAYYPPFDIIIDQQDQFSGFDVALMMEICKRLQMNCVFKPLPLAELFKNVQTGNVRLAIGALIITPERQENFLFSTPYLISKGRFVTLKSNQFHQISEVCNKNIGVIKGSIYNLVAKLTCDSPVQLLEYVNTQDAYTALTNHQVSAFITDDEAAKYWIANNNQFSLLGAPLFTGTGYAVMANPNENTLINKINEVLVNIKNDGTYSRIYSTYF